VGNVTEVILENIAPHSSAKYAHNLICNLLNLMCTISSAWASLDQYCIAEIIAGQ
jgi:hypothetical protein